MYFTTSPAIQRRFFFAAAARAFSGVDRRGKIGAADDFIISVAVRVIHHFGDVGGIDQDSRIFGEPGQSAAVLIVMQLLHN
jgi:hypothetical protein